MDINSVRSRIVFAKELEINDCLQYLDVFIEESPTSFTDSNTGTHTYRPSLKKVEFCSVAQETKPC